MCCLFANLVMPKVVNSDDFRVLRNSYSICLDHAGAQYSKTFCEPLPKRAGEQCTTNTLEPVASAKSNEVVNNACAENCRTGFCPKRTINSGSRPVAEIKFTFHLVEALRLFC